MLTVLSIRWGKVVYSLTHEIDGDVVGVLMMVERERYIRLHSLYVKPEYRNRGIAKGLIKEALEWRPAKDYYVEVDSFEDDDQPDGLDDWKIQEMYEKLGFQSISNHPFALVKYAL